MVSKSETGHDKNVANFNQIITYCTSYNEKYNPSPEHLKLTALQELSASAANAMKGLTTAETAYGNTTNDREIAFEPLKKLCTRIFNAFEVCGTKPQTIADAKSVNRKIQGKSAKKAKTSTAGAAAEASDPKTISVSQQSYDNLLANFSRLAEIVSSEPLYNPNETDLTTEAIGALLTLLTEKNQEVQKAIAALNNSRISRDKIMYASGTGMYAVSQGVKKYMKSVFGADSTEFKQVNGIILVNRK